MPTVTIVGKIFKTRKLIATLFATVVSECKSGWLLTIK